MRSRRAFTLLEVLVAVSILGLGLTAILSAQAGAFSSSAHSRNISVAVGLLRCKMSEVEEHLLKDGMQELDENDSGPCCDGDDAPGMTCSWKIEKPELPEPKLGDLDLDTDVGSGDLGALGALSNIEQGKQSVEPGGNLADIGKALGGGESGDTAAMAGGLATMVMNLVYPDIKSLFEASTRRVTVTLTWREGTKEHSVDVSQWITSPRQAGLVGDIPGEENAIDKALEGSSSGTTSGGR